MCVLKPVPLCLVIFLSAFLLNPIAFGLSPGESPALPAIQTQDGSTVQLSKFSGKLIYLDIWASWCTTCMKSLPWLQKLQDKYGKDLFQVVAVNVDEDRASAEKALKRTGSSFLVAFDPAGDTPNLFNVGAIPTSFLIGRDGKVISIHEGLEEDDQTKIEGEIERNLRAAKPTGL